MKISRSIPGGERTFATFWSLRRIFQKRRLSAWNRTTVRRKIFCKPLQQSWRTMTGEKGRIFGRHATVDRGSDTTKLQMERMKRFLRPITLRNIFARSPIRARTGVPQFCTAPIRSRACLKKPCPLSVEVPRGRRIFVLRTGRDQGHDLVPESHTQPRRLNLAVARDQYARARYWQGHTGDPGARSAGDRSFTVGSTWGGHSETTFAAAGAGGVEVV